MADNERGNKEENTHEPELEWYDCEDGHIHLYANYISAPFDIGEFETLIAALDHKIYEAAVQQADVISFFLPLTHHVVADVEKLKVVIGKMKEHAAGYRTRFPEGYLAPLPPM